MSDIFIACEADGDLRVAKGLAEKMLLEKLTWFADLDVEARPVWGGFPISSDFLRWASIGKVYKAVEDEKPPRVRAVLGRFRDGLPPKLEAVNALKALRLAELVSAYAAVLMRDVDQHSREALQIGLEHGKLEYLRTRINHGQKPVQVIIGTPDRYRETWLLAAFVAKNTTEKERLKTEQKAVIGVDLQKEPHRLRDAPGQPRCAKDIWERLSNNDFTREDACWNDVPFEILHANGFGCGLSAYLLEVEKHLLPAVQSGQS